MLWILAVLIFSDKSGHQSHCEMLPNVAVARTVAVAQALFGSVLLGILGYELTKILVRLW